LYYLIDLLDFIHSVSDSHFYLFSLGGPLIVPGETQDEDIQIGVVSWGYGCARDKYPGVYARISSRFDWIKRNVCRESTSLPINLCDGSYAPSLSPVTSSPTLSSAPSTGPVEGFTYIGEGWCLDSDDDFYSDFEIDFVRGNDNDCIKWCSQVQHPDFVGVEVDHRWSFVTCVCIFSGGLPEDVNRTDYDPHATDWGNDFGVGFVQNTTGTSGVSCYQYDVRVSSVM
jgi:hypothetical protein